MKKILSLILSLTLMLSFTACGTKAEAGWEEQYDLGIKYIGEANYEEAVIVFTKALEIDPKQPAVYIALAEAYARQGDYTFAYSTLDKAVGIFGETEELTAAKDKILWREHTSVVRTEREIYEDGSYRIYEYNQADRLVRTRTYANDEYMFAVDEYDINGTHMRQEWYRENGTTEHIYEFDTKGNLIRQTFFSEDGTVDFVKADDYNDAGDCIRSTWYNADGSVRNMEEYS